MSLTSNIDPFEILELWGIAMKLPPVALLVSSSQAHKSLGKELSSKPNGAKVCACSASISAITMRCRLAPPGIREYSQPINAVNSPGSLCASAVSVMSFQVSISTVGCLGINPLTRSSSHPSIAVTALSEGWGRIEVNSSRPSWPSIASRNKYCTNRVHNISRQVRPSVIIGLR